MPQSDEIVVFDTGPLSHFAKADWLGILKTLSSDKRAVIPDIVQQELRRGASSYPHLERVLRCNWLDDRVARNVASARSVTVKGSLGLLCDAIRAGLLTVPLVSANADDLLAGDYRLPFAPGGFERWAYENDMF